MRGSRRQAPEFRVDTEGQEVVGRLEVPVDVSPGEALQATGSFLLEQFPYAGCLTGRVGRHCTRGRMTTGALWLG